jgi:predicted transcriptional regulator
MYRRLYEIAADIVEAQASFAQMSPESLEQALSTVFVTLQRMKMAEDGGFLLDTAKPSEQLLKEAPERIDPKGSIQEDKVICLECGAEMRQLTGRHLSSHGLSSREYKTKYGFPQSQSLSAKAISRARSKAAKKRGLPEKLLQLQKQRKQQKLDAAMTESTATSSAPPEKPTAKAQARRGRKKKTDK